MPKVSVFNIMYVHPIFCNHHLLKLNIGRHKIELPQTKRSTPFFLRHDHTANYHIPSNCDQLVTRTLYNLYVSVLEPAFTHLQGVSGEVLTTKLAPCPALRTRVLEMVLHQNTWYLRPAFIGAGNGVMFACVKMSLSKETHIFSNNAQSMSRQPSQRWNYSVITFRLSVLSDIQSEETEKSSDSCILQPTCCHTPCMWVNF